MLNERWVFYENTVPETVAKGVVCRVLAYSEDVM